MNPVTLVISILQTIAGAVLQNRTNPGKVAEYAGYLQLAGVLAARWTEGNADLQVLDTQLKEAVGADRGLTPEQRQAWRDRDDLATDVAREWLSDHPAV